MTIVGAIPFGAGGGGNYGWITRSPSAIESSILINKPDVVASPVFHASETPMNRYLPRDLHPSPSKKKKKKKTSQRGNPRGVLSHFARAARERPLPDSRILVPRYARVLHRQQTATWPCYISRYVYGSYVSNQLRSENS